MITRSRASLYAKGTPEGGGGRRAQQLAECQSAAFFSALGSPLPPLASMSLHGLDGGVYPNSGIPQWVVKNVQMQSVDPLSGVSLQYSTSLLPSAPCRGPQGVGKTLFAAWLSFQREYNGWIFIFLCARGPRNADRPRYKRSCPSTQAGTGKDDGDDGGTCSGEDGDWGGGHRGWWRTNRAVLS